METSIQGAQQLPPVHQRHPALSVVTWKRSRIYTSIQPVTYTYLAGVSNYNTIFTDRKLIRGPQTRHLGPYVLSRDCLAVQLPIGPLPNRRSKWSLSNHFLELTFLNSTSDSSFLFFETSIVTPARLGTCTPSLALLSLPLQSLQLRAQSYSVRAPKMYPTAAQLRSVTTPAVSALLKERIRRPSMLKKLCQPEDLLHHFPDGAYIGWSGFTGVGYPKCVIVRAARSELDG